MSKKLTFKDSIADKLTKMDTFLSNNPNTNLGYGMMNLSPSTNRSSQTLDSKQIFQESETWVSPKSHLLQRPCESLHSSRYISIYF